MDLIKLHLRHDTTMTSHISLWTERSRHISVCLATLLSLNDDKGNNSSDWCLNSLIEFGTKSWPRTWESSRNLGPLRTGLWKCAKLLITQLRLVWFCLNSVHSLIMWYLMYYKCSSQGVKDQGHSMRCEVTMAKIY